MNGKSREQEQSYHPALQEVFHQSIITVSLLSFLRGKSHLLPLLPHCCDYKKGDVGIMCIITFIQCK